MTQDQRKRYLAVKRSKDSRPETKTPPRMTRPLNGYEVVGHGAFRRRLTAGVAAE